MTQDLSAGAKPVHPQSRFIRGGLIAVSFLLLAIRGLAPVASFGGWTTLFVFGGAACITCLAAAYAERTSTSGAWSADALSYVLLLHFPIWAFFYFARGANHGVDAINHLEYVRSLVFDHDLDVRNDDVILGGSMELPEEFDKTQINMHGIGPAFVWLPLYLTAHGLCSFIGQACTGASRPYLAAATLTSLCLTAFGLIAAYRLCLRFASRSAAFVATLGIAWGTFLFWYVTTEPTMSHNLSFATAALALLLIAREPDSWRRWFFLGLVIGYSASVRWANGLLGVAALPTLFFPQRSQSRAALARSATALGGGALLAFLPQMYAWFRIFGTPLLVPNGEGFLDRPPAFLDILFSPHGGLFNWSPLLYLSIAGLFAWSRLSWRTALGYWLTLIGLYITNARVPDWWGGSSFGNRRFCTVLPALAVGLAIALDALARWAKKRPLAFPSLLVLGFVGWNVLLAEGHRDLAWRWGEPATFARMSRAVADGIEQRLGSPFGLPGAVIESARTREPLSEYEASRARRVFSTFILRFGVDDAPYLRSGFSLPLGEGQDTHRAVASGVIAADLRDSVDYELHLVQRAHVLNRADEVHVTFGAASIGSCPLRDEAEECVLLIPRQQVRPSLNEVRLEVVTRESKQRALVYSLVLRPR